MGETCKDTLRAYFHAFPAYFESHERWPIQGNMRVRLSLASKLPPAEVSSSILAIVLNAKEEVLYLWPTQKTGTIAHVLIGGRPQRGETPEETAIREVGEETGWRVRPLRMIGFRHFFHLEPCTEENDRPYPDFIQPVYVAQAREYEPDLAVSGDRIPVEFMAFEAAEEAIDPAQRRLLYEALNQVRQMLGQRDKSK